MINENGQMLTRAIGENELDCAREARYWNLSAYLRQWTVRALAHRRNRLTLVLTAGQCTACRVLLDQIDTYAVYFEPDHFLVHLVGGDLFNDNVTHLMIDGVLFESPGVPLLLTFDIQDPGLRFLASQVGPFDLDETRIAVARFARGGHSGHTLEEDGVAVDVSFPLTRIPMLTAAGQPDFCICPPSTLGG